MYENIRLFRRRFIPDELVLLKDDEIVSVTDDKIVTRWTFLKPREDFTYGESTYYRKKGLKISRIMDDQRNFLHWYIDIVRECGSEALNVPAGTRISEKAARYFKDGRKDTDEIIVFEDLLLDIRVMPNGLIEIMDMDEAMEAYEKGLITEEMLKQAMETCYGFLKELYSRYGKVAPDSEEFVRVE